MPRRTEGLISKVQVVFRVESANLATAVRDKNDICVVGMQTLSIYVP